MNKTNNNNKKNRMLTSLAELSSHNLCHQYHPVLSQPDADFWLNIGDSWA